MDLSSRCCGIVVTLGSDKLTQSTGEGDGKVSDNVEQL